MRSSKPTSKFLKPNNDWIGFTGSIGRWPYFKKTLVVAITGGFALGFGIGMANTSNENGGVPALTLIGAAIGLGAFAFLAYFQFGLIMRRLNDIRGNDAKAPLWTVGTMLLQAIPYLGIAIGALLAFYPGEAARPNVRRLPRHASTNRKAA